MAAVLEKRVAAAAARPHAVPGREESGIEVAVVFTSFEPALAALKHAGAVAERLGGRITLLVPQVVPFPLPLTSPPVLIDWNERRFRMIAEATAVDTEVRLYLCRDRDETVRRFLGHPALVCLGGPRRWWRLTAERRLARVLRRSGYEVVFIETGNAHA